MQTVLSLVSQLEPIRAAFRGEEVDSALRAELEALRLKHELDILTVVDASGRVLPSLPHPLPPRRRARPGPDREAGALGAGRERDRPRHRGRASGRRPPISPSGPTSRSCTPSGRSPPTGRPRTGGWSSRRPCRSSTRRAASGGRWSGGCCSTASSPSWTRVRSTVFGDRTYDGQAGRHGHPLSGRRPDRHQRDARRRHAGAGDARVARGLREGPRARRAVRGSRIRGERLVLLRVRPHPRPRGPCGGHHLRGPPREGLPAVPRRSRPGVPGGEPPRGPPLRGGCPPDLERHAAAGRPPRRGHTPGRGREPGRTGAGRTGRPGARGARPGLQLDGGGARRPEEEPRGGKGRAREGPTPRRRRRTGPISRCWAS